MGACLSLDSEERKARIRSDEIDRQLQYMAKEDSSIIKILLLGAGESGKSTLVKQMKIIHSQGFSQEELNSFKPTLMDNLLSTMKFVLSGMGLLRINLSNPNNKIHAQTVLSSRRGFGEDLIMFPFVTHALRCLWSDQGVRLAVARGYEYELNDSALYLFENMDRICHEKFQPNSEDVIRARVRTTGILETEFAISGIMFRMFDVGGQRSERRKWIQCFDDVKAILFVTALSGYDMTLLEDSNVNRLEESLRLFSSICNNLFFKDTSMILFMNKVDLFQEKILNSGRHLRYYFPSYTGADCDVDSAARFIQHMFQGCNKNPSKVIYPHFTTATDTSNIQVVFQVVMDTIIRENLEAASLL
ncbi:guanine nucleotide-binding protein G(o) subunit alpha-like [Branchiostoma lanceolatum]|uniref:GNAI2 protein n=1 Tax=Branchiostoma lanceolatum TaxID=7740 RepID=A0A8K0AEE0_BRALA|nr:GNAI2 [Branchiostoma lanceolatum]